MASILDLFPSSKTVIDPNGQSREESVAPKATILDLLRQLFGISNEPRGRGPVQHGPGFDEPMQHPVPAREKKYAPDPSMPLVFAAEDTQPTPTAIQPTGPLARNPNINRFKIRPEVQNAILTAAKTYGLPPELLFDIALQESSFDPGLVNNTPAGLQAGNPTGLYQFTDGTWNTVKKYASRPGSSLKLPNLDRTDPNTNAAAAAYLIKNGQLGKWDASEEVWGQYWPVDELDKLGVYKQSLYHVPGKRASDRLKGK